MHGGAARLGENGEQASVYGIGGHHEKNATRRSGSRRHRVPDRDQGDKSGSATWRFVLWGVPVVMSGPLRL
ncbi:hypothetical protein Lesp01_30830 [Lentzea sp. NBRC 102530]|nr:hypothetical protein Lesp01_30830 [Lentzea sp. NBRC 102530]